MQADIFEEIGASTDLRVRHGLPYPLSVSFVEYLSDITEVMKYHHEVFLLDNWNSDFSVKGFMLFLKVRQMLTRVHNWAKPKYPYYRKHGLCCISLLCSPSLKCDNQSTWIEEVAVTFGRSRQRKSVIGHMGEVLDDVMRTLQNMDSHSMRRRNVLSVPSWNILKELHHHCAFVLVLGEVGFGGKEVELAFGYDVTAASCANVGQSL